MLKKRGIEPVTGYYEVTILLPKNMHGDIDNRQKAVLDFLVSRELTDDDRYCRSATVKRSAGIPDKECEVEVKVG